MKKGDKLYCIKNQENLFGEILFEKGKIYTVLDFDDPFSVYLDHILYGNEYSYFPVDWVEKNFITIKESRKLKLKELKK